LIDGADTVEVGCGGPEHVAEIVERRRERDKRNGENDASLELPELADRSIDVVHN